jgi:hypothetical protein
VTLTLKWAIRNMRSARHLNVVNIRIRCLRGSERKGFRAEGVQRGSKIKSYDLWPLSLTLTLKQAILNMASAHGLNVVNICVWFLRNPSNGSRVTERKGNKVIWPLTPKSDLELEASHPEHGFCTSSQCGKHLCQVSSKSFKWFKSYRAEEKLLMTDGQIAEAIT